MPLHKKHKSVRDTAVTEDVSHQQISSYFIGPQAENLSYFEDNIHTILKELGMARTNYFGGDGVSRSLRSHSPLQPLAFFVVLTREEGVFCHWVMALLTRERGNAAIHHHRRPEYGGVPEVDGPTQARGPESVEPHGEDFDPLLVAAI